MLVLMLVLVLVSMRRSVHVRERAAAVAGTAAAALLWGDVCGVRGHHNAGVQCLRRVVVHAMRVRRVLLMGENGSVAAAHDVSVRLTPSVHGVR